MNDPAASGRWFRQGFLFKSRGKPQGMKPTGGKKSYSEKGFSILVGFGRNGPNIFQEKETGNHLCGMC